VTEKTRKGVPILIGVGAGRFQVGVSLGKPACSGVVGSHGG
jgi:hypothetical protein